MNDALENLLKTSQLWRASQGVDEGVDPGASPGPPTLPTGYPKLDRCLPGGGWPRHALIEILLEHSGSGELKLLMPLLARLGQAGADDDGDHDGDQAGWIAWIAPPFQPYPPALLQWGIDLSRMLVVRPRRSGETLWAAEQALASGNCRAVLLWPEKVDHTASRRLQLAAVKGACQAFVFRSWRALLQPSAAVLRLRLEPGAQGTDVGIVKSRGGRPAVVRNYAE